MSKRRIIATAVGLAGSVALGVGFQAVIAIDDCGGDFESACPDEATPYFIAFMVGLPVAIIAGVMGGRFALTGMFLAIGLGSLWAGFQAPADGKVFPYVFGGTFTLFSAVPLALIPLRMRKRAQITGIVAEGGTAIGIVVDLVDTGATINNDPLVQLTLRIEPEDGSAAFEGVKPVTFSRLELPYRGQRFPIWYDRADPAEFVLGKKLEESDSPQVRRLFERAAAGQPPRPSAGIEVPEQQPPADPLDRLAKLHQLKLSGALTEQEFQMQKAKLLED